MKKHLLLTCTAFSLSLLLPQQSHSAGNDSLDADALLKRLEKQQKQLEAQQEEMKRLSTEMRNIKKSKPKANPVRRSVVNVNNRPEKVGVDRKQEDRTEPPQIAAVQNNGVLLTKGRAVLEPTLEYSRSSAVNVSVAGFTVVEAINFGFFEISDVDRDTLTASLTGRLGVGSDTEIEMRIPYLYRNDSTLGRATAATSDSLSTVDGNNLGDIELAVRHQLTHGENGWPFLIGGLRFKSNTGKDPFEVGTDPVTGLQTELPTGSGFLAFQPTISAILPSDPVVLYGSLGYLYNIKRSIGGSFGEIDPGDSVSLGLGMGFSANEKTSFSLGYSHNYVMETKQNGVRLANSDDLHVGSFSTGFAYRPNNKVSYNVNIDAGLTEDAPDVRLTFRVPMAFDLF